MASKSTKYVTKNGVIDLSKLTKEMDKQNEKEHSKYVSTITSGRQRNRLSCYSCSVPNCTHPAVCHNAISCYTSIIRDTSGLIQKSKGMLECILEMTTLQNYIYMAGSLFQKSQMFA